MALDPWHRFRYQLRAAEHDDEFPVARVHLRSLVCGNLLSTGPNGFAFAEGEDPAKLWRAVLGALYRIMRSSTIFGESDMLMIKDLSDEQAGEGAVMRNLSFRRFEMESNMVLQLEPMWTSFDDYLNDMRSDFRSRIKKTLHNLEELGIMLERLGPERWKPLLPKYTGSTNRYMIARSCAWLLFGFQPLHGITKAILALWWPAPRRAAKSLASLLLFRDGDSAFGHYTGFDKAMAARGLPLYMSLIYAGVAQAIDM